MNKLPDDVTEVLLALRDNLSTTAWDIGDIANDLSLELQDWNESDIHREMAKFLQVMPVTVRGRARVAGFYPPRVREQFDVLSFSHFREAMKLGEPRAAESVLHWAVEATTYNGTPATVAALSRHIRELLLENEDADEVLIKKLKARGESFAKALADYDNEDAEVLQAAVCDFLDTLEKVADV